MIWHPFTAQLGGEAPLKISRAEREYVFDVEGRRYVDAIAHGGQLFTAITTRRLSGRSAGNWQSLTMSFSQGSRMRAVSLLIGRSCI